MAAKANIIVSEEALVLFESDKAVIMPISRLIALCRYWQKVLYLEHWEIAIRIDRKSEFKGDNEAEVNYTLATAKATIQILSPLDYGSGPFKQDMEKSLVHELLHLHFAPFDTTEDESLAHTMLERAIDHIAKTLVNLRRETKKERR